MDNYIEYKEGYKYQLYNTYVVYINVKPASNIISTGGYIGLGNSGRLVIKKGYCWDGPSGPTIDTPDFMRGSLVHDALYQLMREGSLKRSRRKEVDLLLRKHCKEDGMSSIRAWWVYSALRLFAHKSSTPTNIRQIQRAP